MSEAMNEVLFLSNPRDDAEIKEIKRRLEEKALNYSILTYDEIRKPGILEKIIGERKLKAVVVFMGSAKLYPEISGLLRSILKNIPPVVVILSTSGDLIQVPIFLQSIEYIDFRREQGVEAFERLNTAISERIGWDRS